ncbi:hypothetical protein Y032_0060g3102 [Ancylostoma ceylanicum]|uniref:Secreted protein n=1 Tax=Ancylostoma ceylanicum TaxID=53326 RepID=A0A016U277_9BILA|nr:hypothetical protein Y032_0060g3102 [Ancylostoma ceylanicum]
MRKIFGRRHPPLLNLILAMRSLTAQAKARLYRMKICPTNRGLSAGATKLKERKWSGPCLDSNGSGLDRFLPLY